MTTVARPMCKIEVLKSVGMLRSLVKTDIAGQLDPTVLTNQAQKYEEEIKPILNSVATSSTLAIMRG
jgi:uroporphyrinogen-III decarboxylase